MDNGIIEIRDPEINVEAIMERIRHSIRQRQPAATPTDDAPLPPPAPDSAPLFPLTAPTDGDGLPQSLRHYLRLANQFHDAPTAAVLPTSTRLGPLGWLWAKVVLKVVNRLRAYVMQAFDYQVSFNSHAVRTLNEMAGTLAGAARQLEALEEQAATLGQERDDVATRLAESERARSALEDSLQKARREVARMEAVEQAVAAIQAQVNELATAATVEELSSSVEHTQHQAAEATLVIAALKAQMQQVGRQAATIEPLRDQVSRQANDLHSAQATTRQLGETMGALDAQVQQVGHEAASIEPLRDQVTRQADDLHSAQATARQLSETMAALEAQVQQLGHRAASVELLPDQVSALASALQRVQDEADQLAHATTTIEADVQQLGRQAASVEPLRDQVTTLASDLAQVGEVVAEWRRREQVQWPAFEHQEQFRGSADDIKRRLTYYVRFFQPAQRVLDAGCGRGEFLLCLREAGIGGYGVDTDGDMVRYCQRHQLDVRQEDALPHLQSLPDKSLDGIFAAHLIEHLDFERQLRFYREAKRTLKTGAYLVCETPNPLTLLTAASQFHIDPTHQNPVHPDTLQFLLQSTGFRHVELYFSSPHPSEAQLQLLPVDEPGSDGTKALEALNHNTERLNQLLFGAQNYAAIARR